MISFERADYDYIDLFTEKKYILSIQRVKRIFRQITLALTHIHKKGFSHGDLKPDQFLMFGDNDAKLADFDLMQKKSSLDYDTKEIASILNKNRTKSYFAPELEDFMELLH